MKTYSILCWPLLLKRYQPEQYCLLMKSQNNNGLNGARAFRQSNKHMVTMQLVVQSLLMETLASAPLRCLAFFALQFRFSSTTPTLNSFNSITILHQHHEHVSYTQLVTGEQKTSQYRDLLLLGHHILLLTNALICLPSESGSSQLDSPFPCKSLEKIGIILRKSVAPCSSWTNFRQSESMHELVWFGPTLIT